MLGTPGSSSCAASRFLSLGEKLPRLIHIQWLGCIEQRQGDANIRELAQQTIFPSSLNAENELSATQSLATCSQAMNSRHTSKEFDPVIYLVSRSIWELPSDDVPFEDNQNLGMGPSWATIFCMPTHPCYSTPPQNPWSWLPAIHITT